MSREKGGWRLSICEECIKSEEKENNLGWYIKNSNEKLIACVKKNAAVNEIESTTGYFEF